jgi:AraC-like DNA-binding protein
MVYVNNKNKNMDNKFSYEYYAHPSGQGMFPIGKTPVSIDYIGFYICEGGSANVAIDGKAITLTPFNVCVVLPCTIVRIENASDDFVGFGAKASIISIDELFIPNIGKYYTYIKNTPCISISQFKLEIIKQLTCIINQKINFMNGEIDYLATRNMLNSLIYEIISCYANHADTVKSSRQDIIFREFMNLVLRYHKSERRIAFYADKMYMSARYLSSVVKNKTGYSAAYWIDSMVLKEAKNMLRNSDMSVQQVSETLHFANPSFFGQYFMRHTGETPHKFRNN